MTPSGIRNISVEVAATALSAGANTVVTLPAQTAILAAGVEVTEALTGASALTFDLGTGLDDDAFASGYAMAGKSVGAVAPMAGGMATLVPKTPSTSPLIHSQAPPQAASCVCGQWSWMSMAKVPKKSIVTT